jgi:hypothetical protein
MVKRVWMDQETRDFLLALESRQDAKSEARLSALEDRLEARLETRFDVKVQQLEVRLRAHIDDVGIRSRAHTEEVETRLLTEFWKWARGSDMRERRNTTDIVEINARISSLEDRLRDLERRHPQQ